MQALPWENESAHCFDDTDDGLSEIETVLSTFGSVAALQQTAALESFITHQQTDNDRPGHDVQGINVSAASIWVKLAAALSDLLNEPATLT